jgi:thiol oxidase
MSEKEVNNSGSRGICFMHTIIIYIFITLLIVYTLIAFVSSLPSLNKPLYTRSQTINILSDNNFSANVFYNELNSNRLQLIQFYNSWCGHCIAFAPTFKSFAEDIKDWTHLITISVVDCAQEINTKLCRNMEINVYPTLKTFWFSPKDTQKGYEFRGFIFIFRLVLVQINSCFL